MSLFEEAIAAMRARIHENVPESIERVDVDPAGFLHISLDLDGRSRWFRFQRDRLEEVLPVADRRLPCTRSLANEDGWELLAYRPGRRVVVRTTREGRPVVIKGYRKRRSRPAARLHALAERTFAPDVIRIPRLIEHDAEHETVAFEWLDATEVSLEDADVFGVLGRALGNLGVAPVEDLPTFGPDSEIEVLDRWAERFVLACDALPPGWAAMRERVAAALPGEEAARVPCHRDLHDGQLMKLEEGLGLIDFDLYCRADPALDPANLLVHLRLRRLQGIRGATEDAVERCGQRLLEGLGWPLDGPERHHLSFYQATSFLRLALVYGLRPRWSELSSPLIELAGLCLAGPVRSNRSPS